MKYYYLFFLFLKLLITFQFILMLLNRQLIGPKAHMITEIVFKTCLGIFIEYMVLFRNISGLDWEDRMIFSFAGWLLIADAYINDLPDVIAMFNE